MGTLILWIGYAILAVIGVVVGIIAFGFLGWALALVLIIVGILEGMPGMVIGGIVVGVIWIIAMAALFSSR